MIRHVSSRREDHISDAVGCFRLFGGVFVLSGIGALSVAAFGSTGIDAYPLGARLLVVAIGAGHLAGGLSIWGGRSIASRVSRAGVEWTERRPLRGTSQRQIAPSEVRGIHIVSEPDSDGDDTHRVALRLASGESLPLSRQSTPSREQAEAISEAVARRLGLVS